MPLQPKTILFSSLIYMAFFASGAASLIAEVSWNRMLIVVVGNSISAAALIIVVFMGGLGLGSYAGGRIFAQRRPSLIPYLLSRSRSGSTSPHRPSSGSCRSSSLDGRQRPSRPDDLLRLTVSIGRFLSRLSDGGDVPGDDLGSAPDTRCGRARGSVSHSINTLGAAIGCFADTISFSSDVQATFSPPSVSTCSRPAARSQPRSYEKEASLPRNGTGGGAALRRMPTPSRFDCSSWPLSASVSFHWPEVLLTRLSILYLGNSVSVFPLVLTAFLLGTGISSVAGTWLYGLLLRRTERADRLFGFTAIAAGISVLITPYLLLSDRIVGTDALARLAEATPRDPWGILGIIVVPTFFMGALLPVAIRMLRKRERDQATRGAATLYALNTAGGLLGAGLVNHYLVPAAGVHGVLVLLTGVCIAIGLAQLLSPERRPLRWLAFSGAQRHWSRFSG
jgi:spermidine synthase